jgi:hypothetical protein
LTTPRFWTVSQALVIQAGYNYYKNGLGQGVVFNYTDPASGDSWQTTFSNLPQAAQVAILTSWSSTNASKVVGGSTTSWFNANPQDIQNSLSNNSYNPFAPQGEGGGYALVGSNLSAVQILLGLTTNSGPLQTTSDPAGNLFRVFANATDDSVQLTGVLTLQTTYGPVQITGQIGDGTITAINGIPLSDQARESLAESQVTLGTVLAANTGLLGSSPAQLQNNVLTSNMLGAVGNGVVLSVDAVTGELTFLQPGSLGAPGATVTIDPGILDATGQIATGTVTYLPSFTYALSEVTGSVSDNPLYDALPEGARLDGAIYTGGQLAELDYTLVDGTSVKQTLLTDDTGAITGTNIESPAVAADGMPIANTFNEVQTDPSGTITATGERIVDPNTGGFLINWHPDLADPNVQVSISYDAVGDVMRVINYASTIDNGQTVQNTYTITEQDGSGRTVLTGQRVIDPVSGDYVDTLRADPSDPNVTTTNAYNINGDLLQTTTVSPTATDGQVMPNSFDIRVIDGATSQIIMAGQETFDPTTGDKTTSYFDLTDHNVLDATTYTAAGVPLGSAASTQSLDANGNPIPNQYDITLYNTEGGVIGGFLNMGPGSAAVLANAAQIDPVLQRSIPDGVTILGTTTSDGVTSGITWRQADGSTVTSTTLTDASGATSGVITITQPPFDAFGQPSAPSSAVLTTYDENGNPIDTPIDTTSISLAGDIGDALGSSIGQIIGRGNALATIGVTAVISVLTSDFGKVVSLAGDGVDLSSIGDIFSDGKPALGIEPVTTQFAAGLEGAAISYVGNYIAGELVGELHLKGVAASAVHMVSATLINLPLNAVVNGVIQTADGSGSVVSNISTNFNTLLSFNNIAVSLGRLAHRLTEPLSTLSAQQAARGRSERRHTEPSGLPGPGARAGADVVGCGMPISLAA